MKVLGIPQKHVKFPCKCQLADQCGLLIMLQEHQCLDYSSNQRLRFIFMAGTLLIGVGATPVYTLGVAYMDENVPKAKSALYLGKFFTKLFSHSILRGFSRKMELNKNFKFHFSFQIPFFLRIFFQHYSAQASLIC